MGKYNQVTADIITKLKEILGAKQVVTDQSIIEPYSHDEVPDSHYAHMPDVVVFPETTEQVAAVVKFANEYLIPVVPRGAGTGLACGAVASLGGIVLSLEKMGEVLEINADSLYVVVEPGVRTDDIQKAVK